MEFVDTFEYHRNNPQESLSDYYRKLRFDLASKVNSRQKIYLDTKFWVLLRNGLTDPILFEKESELLELAQRLVKNKACIFPISEDVFLEVVRQTDPDTLLNTVKLIDKLSLGISTISHEERTQLELMHFWYSQVGQETYPPLDMAWTKLAYTMGFNTFTHPAFSDSENLVIQKAFTDQMWTCSLYEKIEMLLSNGGLSYLPKQPSAENINIGKFAHMHEAATFKQMFLNEVAGWIDVYGDMLCEMMEHTYFRMTGNSIPETRAQEEREETKRNMGNLVYNLFRLDKVGTYLPSVRITSGLYAAVRWDKKQKFQDHDFHDFRHACAALPYFDHFFTEKRLTHLVTQNQLKLDRMFECQVCSKVSQAIKILESISKQKFG